MRLICFLRSNQSLLPIFLISWQILIEIRQICSQNRSLYQYCSIRCFYGKSKHSRSHTYTGLRMIIYSVLLPFFFHARNLSAVFFDKMGHIFLSVLFHLSLNAIIAQKIYYVTKIVSFTIFWSNNNCNQNNYIKTDNAFINKK